MFQVHKNTSCRDVVLTLKNAICNYWIPTLRNLETLIVRKYCSFTWYYSSQYSWVKPGPLPDDRIEQAMSFRLIGTTYAGAICYCTKTKKELKAYVLKFSCSLSRAVHSKLIPNTTQEFIKYLKRLIGRTRKPSNICSDNAEPFQAAANCLK